MPAVAAPANSPASAERIQSAQDPFKTRLLNAGEAGDVEKIETTKGQVAADQEKLKSGQISAETYAKSLADAKDVVIAIAARQLESAAVQTSAARTMTQAGDYGKAIDYATKGIALAPKDPFPLTTRGMAYYDAGDFAKAGADAEHALALDPGNPVAKAIFELSKKRVPGDGGAGLQRALARAGREISAMPESPYLPAESPAATQAVPDDDSRLAVYKTPQGRRYARQFITAERAMKRRDFMTAYGLANEALGSFADNPNLLAVRAISAWNLGEYRTTINDTTQILGKIPDGNGVQGPMLVARASALNDAGRPAEALRDASKAITLFPRNARAYQERAIAKEALHESPESVAADYKEAADIDPSMKPAYDEAMERLFHQGQPRRPTPARVDAKGQFDQFLAELEQNGVSGQWVFLIFAAGVLLTLLVIAAGYLLGRLFRG